MYLNNVELIGFLGADAELKKTGTGKSVTTLSIATKTFWKKPDGERKEHTEWHQVTCWAGLADFAGTLTKGAHVRIEGELRSREYETDNGKVKTYEIIASSLLSLRAGQTARSEQAETTGEGRA